MHDRRSRSVGMNMILSAAALLIGCATDAEPGSADPADDAISASDAAGDTVLDAALDTASDSAGEGTEVDDATLSPDSGDVDYTSAGCPIELTPAVGEVLTEYGVVRGNSHGNGWAWRGIPYAAPPVGDRRFMPPEPPSCYDGGLNASEFGEKCLQYDGLQQVGSEDCLTLNVFAPTDVSDAPVLFFIHGGGNIQGSSSQNLGPNNHIYDGRHLIERGVVVVTINYRLGPFGFMALDELGALGSSGNQGLRDILAALGWVQRNISRFGGDPDRVMVFGESAGAVNTCAMVASPAAAGLFSAALMQSGGCHQPEGAVAEANMAYRISTESSCAGSEDVLTCLQTQDASTLLAELRGSVAVGSTTVGPNPKSYGPTVDGDVLPKSPFDAIVAGEHNAVPFVVGTNEDELAEMITTEVADEAAYLALLNQMFVILGAEPLEAIKAAYPVADYPSAQAALVALLSDLRFTCPARTLTRAAAAAQSEPVYRYFFTRDPANTQGKQAVHGLELLYVFGTMSDIPLFVPDPADVTLGATLRAYWSRFAESGDPNGGSDPAWTTVGTTDQTMNLTVPPAMIAGPRTAECDMWDAALESVLD